MHTHNDVREYGVVACRGRKAPRHQSMPGCIEHHRKVLQHPISVPTQMTALNPLQVFFYPLQPTAEQDAHIAPSLKRLP